jgi:glycosyltransferase involved in cell wall biosynthesis
MSRQLVSIITPTYNRESYLSSALRCFLSQDYGNTEWLILDDSDQASKTLGKPSQSNISYEHVNRRMTIGEKRNLLIEKAKGEIIVQFDDDDFYGPTYVSTMVGALDDLEADLINLRGWFIYDHRSNFFGYWDLMQKVGLHYWCASDGVTPIIVNEQNNKVLENNHLGYGFSFVFRRKVWRATPFPNINWNEDGAFALSANALFNVTGIMDEIGICLHFLHFQSTAECYPQYHFPPTLLKRFFPSASGPK